MLFLGIEESCRRQRKARKRKSYTLYTHSAPLVFRTHSPGISVSAFATSSYANVAPRYTLPGLEAALFLFQEAPVSIAWSWLPPSRPK